MARASARDLTAETMRFFLVVSLFCMSTIALGEEVTLPSMALSPADFLTELADAARHMGGLSTFAKVAVIITLIVSSIKVTAFRDRVWSRLGPAQVLVGPTLALVAGLLGLMGDSGTPLSLASVVAYLTAGGGAILLHQALDALKSLPGLGAPYQKAIATVEQTLGAPPKKP